MKYEKPELVGLKPASESIQTSVLHKTGASSNDGESIYATSPAYEADE